MTTIRKESLSVTDELAAALRETKQLISIATCEMEAREITPILQRINDALDKYEAAKAQEPKSICSTYHSRVLNGNCSNCGHSYAVHGHAQEPHAAKAQECHKCGGLGEYLIARPPHGNPGNLVKCDCVRSLPDGLAMRLDGSLTLTNSGVERMDKALLASTETLYDLPTDEKGFPVVKVPGHVVNHMEWRNHALIVTVGPRQAHEPSNLVKWLREHADCAEDHMFERATLPPYIEKLREAADRIEALEAEKHS